jgi:hypothetical protein
MSAASARGCGGEKGSVGSDDAKPEAEKRVADAGALRMEHQFIDRALEIRAERLRQFPVAGNPAPQGVGAQGICIPLVPYAGGPAQSGQDFCWKADEEREERQKDGVAKRWVAKRCSFKRLLVLQYGRLSVNGGVGRGGYRPCHRIGGESVG